MNNLNCIFLPENFHVSRYRDIQNALGFEINMTAHFSEQAEIMKNYLFIQASLNNMLRGKETVAEFLDKVESTNCIAMDDYLFDTFENLEFLGIA